MKKTLGIIVLTIFLGSFSFAAASTLYWQPIATTTINTIYTHYILRMCIPVSSNANMYSVSFATGPGVSTTTSSWALYVSTSSSPVCATATQVSNNALGTLQPSTIYTATTTAFSLSGVSYLRIEIFDGGGGATPITNQALGTTGKLDNGDINNNPYLKIEDSINSNINWTDITITPNIDWTAIQYVPTSTSLFSDADASSTLASITEQCAEAGNVFARGICWSFAYLFIPNPTVFNQYVGLASTTAQKFPFSYVVGIYELLGTLQASTSKNMISPHIDFASVDPAASSSFGTILPDITILSTSTIQQYMPSGMWNIIYFWMQGALWLGLGFKVFKEGYNMLHH